MTQVTPSVQHVDAWSCPTTLYASENALDNLANLVGGQAIILVTDLFVLDRVDVIRRIKSNLPVSCEVVRNPADSDFEFLQRVCEASARYPHQTIVACGGGSVLDVARIAALARAEPLLMTWVIRSVEKGGVCFWPTRRVRACPIVCVPTTLGTGSEVSPVAVLRHERRVAMLVGPALRSATSILDPRATACQDKYALTAGLIEPLARVLVPAVTGDSLPLQDGLAASLFGIFQKLGDSAITDSTDKGWRLAAALASTQTHTAFLALNRSPFGHVLWPLATEIMIATGVSKAAALQSLLPAWLTGLQHGALGSGFGSPTRVVALLGVEPIFVARDLMRWFGRVQRPTHMLQLNVDDVAQRVALQWQTHGPFLSSVPLSEIRWLLWACTQELDSIANVAFTVHDK